MAKILADYLRHDLVHGFGSTKTPWPFDVKVFVADRPKFQVELDRSGRRRALSINSVTFADYVLGAFETVKARVEGDADLAARICAAAKHEFPVSNGVVNQFNKFAAREINRAKPKRW